MSDFVVNDKRLFGKDGQVKAEDVDEPQRKKFSASPDDKTDRAAAHGQKGGSPHPPVTFAGFIFGLATSALVNLGEYKNPDDAEAAPDLDLARQTIDLLGLLEAKTKGNLDDEEAELLKNLLYDLRVKYVALVKA